MALLPAELRGSATLEKWGSEVEKALRAARVRIAHRRALAFGAATLPYAVALSAAWVAIIRFTLADLPAWPAIFFPALWVVVLVWRARSRDISSGEAARYLDHTLRLDERLSTCLELLRSTPINGLRRGSERSRVPEVLLADTAFELKTRKASLPASWGYRLSSRQAVVLAVALLAFLGALATPSTVTPLRAERDQLRLAVEQELGRISDLRAEIVSKPALPDLARQQILDELDRLTTSLSSDKADRSDMLAAMADAQSRLRELTPDTPADFDGLTAAARTVQLTAYNAMRNRNAAGESEVDPDISLNDFPGLTELGKAASAATALAGLASGLSSAQARITGSNLHRAGEQTKGQDPGLSQRLDEAGQEIGAGHSKQGAESLRDVAARFTQAEKRLQLAQALDKSLSALDEGRQSIAQAGSSVSRKGQVGFRRPGTRQAPSTAAGRGGATPSAGATGDSQTSGDTANQESAFGPGMGSNSPDYSAQSQSASGGSQQQSGGSGGAAQGGDGDTTGAAQAGGGPGASADGQQTGSATGPASPGDGSRGELSGPVSAPVGGGGGAISRVVNPAGAGVAGAQPQDAGTPEPDGTVLLPATSPGEAAQAGDVPEQAAPPPSGSNEGIAGKPGQVGGGQRTDAGTGGGTRNQIKTPYREVIGRYAEQASQALEQTYIPADAKEYVRDYFSALGR